MALNLASANAEQIRTFAHEHWWGTGGLSKVRDELLRRRTTAARRLLQEVEQQLAALGYPRPKSASASHGSDVQDLRRHLELGPSAFVP